MPFFDYSIYLYSLNLDFVVFAKSGVTVVQQTTNLTLKTESIDWNYRLANKYFLLYMTAHPKQVIALDF